MTGMPTLETERLLIRPFVMDDLAQVYRLPDVELGAGDPVAGEAETLAQRAHWLQWTVLSYEQLADLRQLPHGDRGVVLKSAGRLIGACGFVPCLGPFEQMPGFFPGEPGKGAGLWSIEVGLFYAISPARRHRPSSTMHGSNFISGA
jgi:hypothetical protein